ncbi:MAG: ribosome biogenesis GTPase Der [Desulfobacteraceae bacterium]
MMVPIVVIVGRPNVGKSTLFNRLTRSRNALVDDRPGVTRDRICVSTTCEGVNMTLVDTGGFEDLGQDPLLKEVRGQVERGMAEADKIIFMVDAKAGLMPGDEAMADLLRRGHKQVLLTVNKVDGPEHEYRIHDFHRLGLGPPLGISAAHGYGLNAFKDELIKDLHPLEARPQDPHQIRVAVLGRPNAGKSSLINRILRDDRLVVSELPGTTRDAVDALFHYRGREYLLIDTAGIRRKARVKEKIEKISMIKALRSLDRCHVAVILLDAERGLSDQDVRICGYALDKGRGLVVAVNKWDLVKTDSRKKEQLYHAVDRRMKFVSYAPKVHVSALTGERVMTLFKAVDTVFDQFCTRISTGEVNRALKEIVQQHPPQRIGRGRLKFLYATQARTRPPTFVLVVNRPDLVHFAYKRFLANQFREHFGLKNIPIQLKFKER